MSDCIAPSTCKRRGECRALTPCRSLAYGIGRRLFDHETDTYDPLPGQQDQQWADPDIRAFWIERAEVVINYLVSSGDLKTQEVST